MEYTINVIERHGHRIPELQFADPRYALAGEMLLTERSFLEQISMTLTDAYLGGKRCEKSFNTFTIDASPNETLIRDDFTYRKVTVETKPFMQAVRAYMEKVRQLRREAWNAANEESQAYADTEE